MPKSVSRLYYASFKMLSTLVLCSIASPSSNECRASDIWLSTAL